MKKTFVRLLCCFIPSRSMRHKIRTALGNDKKSKLEMLGYKVRKTDQGIFINGHNLKIFGRADNTLWTAEAVLGGEYDFDPHGHDFMVIDIGLNIGLTSLYLAQKHFVKKIFSFEPFAPIFDQAKNNINNNPKLSDKITIFNYGLSDRDDTVSISFNKDLPGSMSTVSDRFESGEHEKITATLKQTDKILRPIFDNNPELKIMLKIDCEGGEREILPNLFEHGLFDYISVIVMEYHDNYYEPLVEILKSAGFNVKVSPDISCGTGMIRATKI